MKKLLWIIFVIPLIAHGQFKKRDAYLGATLSRGNDYGNFSVYPFVGFFINSNVALGASLGASSSRSEDDYTLSDGLHHSTSASRNFTINATARRYYSLSDKFYFALQGEVFYRRSHYETSDNDVVNYYSSYGLGASAKPVFVYFPSPRWGIEGGFGELRYEFSRGLSDGTNTSGVYVGLGTVTLGFAYYFRK